MRRGQSVSESFIGEIRIFGCNFAPVGWLECAGQIVSIQQYEMLFALLSTTYGGDGRTTFGLPDLRGSVPVHQGQGTGLTSRLMGQTGGTETVSLLVENLPAHSHTWSANTTAASTATPDSATQLGALPGDALYTSDVNGIASFGFSTAAVGYAGGNLPHENTMPTLPLRVCICVEGGYYPVPA